MLEPLEPRRLFAAVIGQPDPAFGDNGTLVINHGTLGSGATQKLPDGRLLVAEGGDRDAPAPSSVVTLTMLNPNGTVDSTFGGSNGAPAGSVAIDTHTYSFDIASMILAGDKILISGRAVSLSTPTSSEEDDVAIMRLNADGSLDTTFGGPSRGMSDDLPGMVRVKLEDNSGGDADSALDIAVNSAGRIAVTARKETFGSSVILVFHSDGAPDTSFGTGGQLALENSSDADVISFFTANAIQLGSDGSIFLAGDQETDTQVPGQDSVQSFRWELEHLDPNGQILWARGFGTDQFNGVLRAMAFTPQGQLLVAGDTHADFSAALFSAANGMLDQTFGQNGVATAVTGSAVAGPGITVSQTDMHLAQLPDGRFYLFGDVYNVNEEFDAGDGYYLARFSAAGKLDTTFSSANNPAPFFVDGSQDSLNAAGADLVISEGDPIVQNLSEQKISLRRIHSGEGAEGAIRLSRRGTLSVSGDAGDDDITVRLRHRDGRIVVRVNDLNIRSFAPSRIKRIQLFGLGGNDRITLGDGPRGGYLDGGDGNDTLTGSASSADTLNGGAGDDSAAQDPLDTFDSIEHERA